MSHSTPEKADSITPVPARSSASIDAGKLENAEDAFEVFKRGEGTVDFRTVGWVHASVIFLKGKDYTLCECTRAQLDADITTKSSLPPVSSRSLPPCSSWVRCLVPSTCWAGSS